MSRISFSSAVVAVTLALAWSCGSGSARPPVDTSIDGDPDASSWSSGGDASSPSADAANPACGSGTLALTLLNYDGWCKVTVAGAGLSTALSTTVCIRPGATNLVAVPADANHEIGPIPWYGTRNDTGSGDPGDDRHPGGVTESTNADISLTNANKCASVCCPFVDGGGCPGRDTCP